MTNEKPIEIIAYANPGEKAFWDLMSSAQGFAFICGFLTFLVVLFTLNYLWVEKVAWKKQEAATKVTLAISGISAIGVIWYMMKDL